MKALNFNTFFGYENLLHEKPEIVMFGAFLVPIGLLLIISIIGFILRKIGANMYLIHAFLYTLLFTFFFGVFTILILIFITDRNGVKLAYCWLSIFTGMFFFCLFNTNSISKMFMDWSKILKK